MREINIDFLKCDLFYSSDVKSSIDVVVAWIINYAMNVTLFSVAFLPRAWMGTFRAFSMQFHSLTKLLERFLFEYTKTVVAQWETQNIFTESRITPKFIIAKIKSWVDSNSPFYV